MFYFFLGNTPELSLLELTTLYPGDFSLVGKNIASLTADLDLSTLPRLGGTTKLAQEVATTTASSLLLDLTALISADSAKNIAISDYAGTSLTTSEVISIKKQVAQTRPVRFVSLDTGAHELLMLSRQHVLELNIINQAGSLKIAKTVWIYDAADWVSRDRAKPYRDIKHGMLPPKLARIMVNLATLGRSSLTLADPFCGTGTILSEAMMVGCNVIGSDTNPEAVAGAQTNLAWLASTPNLQPTTYNLIQADATHFHEHVEALDCIATEPYMGPLLDERNPTSLAKIKNIAKGLDKLYRGAFKSFSQVLPAGGRIVISLPSFHVYGRKVETISIDTLTSLGYNHISAVPYSKPGAAVIRNITILERI